MNEHQKIFEKIVEEKRCQKCALLLELYEGTKQVPREYWLMTEIFVLLHGSDVCPMIYSLTVENEEKVMLPVCGRCGESHRGLKVYPLTIPSSHFTHYSICPTNGEPIMFHFEIEEGPAAKHARELVKAAQEESP